EDDPERPDGPLEHRRVRDVEREPAFPQETRGLVRLRDPLRGQVHVGPAREPVLEVPYALAVPEQDQLLHGFRPPSPGRIAAGARPSARERRWNALSSSRTTEPLSGARRHPSPRAPRDRFASRSGILAARTGGPLACGPGGRREGGARRISPALAPPPR